MSTHSLSFDGAGDYVNFGTGFPDLDGVCSISLWVKFNTVNSHHALVWDILTGQVAIRLNSAAGIDWFQGSGPGNAAFLTSFSTNTWYHLFFLRTGSAGSWNISMWVDGSADGNNPRTITDDPAASPTSYRFGYGADVGFDHDGFLDEIAVWTSDQSANVSGLADGSIDPATLSPVGLWYFDEGSGSTATDSGSGGNDGTLTGSTTYSTDVPAALAGGGGGSILPLVAVDMANMADMKDMRG